LLAAGVLRVEGTFAAGQAVRVCVIRGRKAGRQGRGEGVASAKASRPVSPDHFADRAKAREVRELRERVAEMNVGGGTPVETTEDEREGAEEEILEFGRGLTNYNSVEINMVKGLRR